MEEVEHILLSVDLDQTELGLLLVIAHPTMLATVGLFGVSSSFGRIHR